MIILVLCPDQERLNRLKAAIQSAGFRTISARSLDDSWAKSYSFDFNAVVIDHELKNDIAASAFRQRFITVNLDQDAEPVAVVMELTGLFRSVPKSCSSMTTRR